MNVHDLGHLLVLLIVVVPFIDWAGWAVLYRGHQQDPGIRSLKERARIAFAIALGTTLVWPLALMASHILPSDAVPGEWVLLLVGLGLLVPSVVNAWWALGIAVDWYRDRRDEE